MYARSTPSIARGPQRHRLGYRRRNIPQQTQSRLSNATACFAFGSMILCHWHCVLRESRHEERNLAAESGSCGLKKCGLFHSLARIWETVGVCITYIDLSWVPPPGPLSHGLTLQTKTLWVPPPGPLSHPSWIPSSGPPSHGFPLSAPGTYSQPPLLTNCGCGS